MTKPLYATQLEDMYYVTYADDAGWISLEDADGNEVDIDFDFESDFTPQFEEYFNHTGRPLYARWNAAEVNNPYVSDRLLLNR